MWRHKPLYFLTLTQTKKISYLGPEALILIIYFIASKGGWSEALGIGLGFLDSALYLTQYSIIKELADILCRSCSRGFTLGRGSILTGSSIQKRNARSSKGSEKNGVNDKISKIVWTKKFVDHQGWDIKCIIIFHHNTSTINLMNNDRESSGKRTRHFDIIRLFGNLL